MKKAYTAVMFLPIGSNQIDFEEKGKQFSSNYIKYFKKLLEELFTSSNSQKKFNESPSQALNNKDELIK